MEPMANDSEITYWGKVSQLKMGDVVSTGVLYTHKREPVIKCLERHVNTPEVLVALEGDSVICFGKPSREGQVGIDGLQAFYIKQGDAFAMHAGTWHWAAVPVKGELSKFLVLFALGTEANDLEVRDLAENLKILI